MNGHGKTVVRLAGARAEDTEAGPALRVIPSWHLGVTVCVCKWGPLCDRTAGDRVPAKNARPLTLTNVAIC